MLKTYELAIKIMRLFSELDPWNSDEDLFEDSLKQTAEMLLSGGADEIARQIDDFDLDEDQWLYKEQQDVLSAIRAYEVPDLWFRETGKLSAEE